MADIKKKTRMVPLQYFLKSSESLNIFRVQKFDYQQFVFVDGHEISALRVGDCSVSGYDVNW